MAVVTESGGARFLTDDERMLKDDMDIENIVCLVRALA